MTKKLSIILLCYNHEKFLEKCLEGIFSQVTEHDYIVYASDDASTDQSQEILKKYKQLYPDKIELLFPEQNRGVSGSFSACYERIKTPYYCILEGDDYWCDNNKIQSQIDVLETNQELIGCTHNFYILDDNTGILNQKHDDNRHPTIISPQYFFGNCYFHTSTYIWREIYPDGLPEYLAHPIYAGDALHAMAYTSQGPLGYIDKPMSVYRVHSTGVWSRINKEQQFIRNVGLHIYANEVFNNVFKNEIRNYLTYLPLVKLFFTLPLNTPQKLNIINKLSQMPLSLQIFMKADQLLNIFLIPLRKIYRYLRKKL